MFSETSEHQLSNGVSHLNLWQFWFFHPPQEIIGGVPGGGPRENPRSLSSSKAEKFEFEFFGHFGGTDGRTDDGQSDLYYPLVADKNLKFTIEKIKKHCLAEMYDVPVHRCMLEISELALVQQKELMLASVAQQWK